MGKMGAVGFMAAGGQNGQASSW